jgi:hypothetical protein
MPSLRAFAFVLFASLAAGIYTGYASTKFHPAQSSTFELVKLGNVNVTFLDNTNLLGYDGCDFVEV